jgi:8-oxo-dGTP pyrophosphatase MutT (NUDIX family)
MPILKRKVLAYLVQRGRLLVFRHSDFPAAGIQVPGGTLLPDENPEAAVLREAGEETGLAGLEVVDFLGEQVRSLAAEGLDQIHHRYYFQLSCSTAVPETWVHFETDPSEGSSAPIAFEFFWAKLPNSVPPLAGGQDYCLNRMIDRLIARGECCSASLTPP